MVFLRELDRIDAHSADGRRVLLSESPEKCKLVSELDILVTGLKYLGVTFPIAGQFDHLKSFCFAYPFCHAGFI